MDTLTHTLFVVRPLGGSLYVGPLQRIATNFRLKAELRTSANVGLRTLSEEQQ